MLHMATPTIQIGGTIQISLGNQSHQYTQPAQAPQQASNLEQAIVNLSKDGWMQNDLSQKIDNVQYAISRLTNLNTVQEKGKFPSQPHQNPKGIHEVEAQEGESSKDLCTVKRGLNVNKKAFLTEQVSAIIQCKSPVKYKDPGCPTISVSIGGTCVEKALLDLGKCEFATLLCLQAVGTWRVKANIHHSILADRSMKIPRGMIEDVLVQVDKSTIQWILLNGVMQLTFGNMTLELNIFHLCKKHIHPKKKKVQRKFACYPVSLRGEKKFYPYSMRRRYKELLRGAPKAILKPLPTELKYAYLEEDKQCPVVISSALTIHQEDCLLEVLRNADFIYPISDSPWVSPTQVVPKKSRITVVQNDKGEDVSTCLTTGWRVCIDYRRLNAVTRKDHFPLPLLIRCLRGSLGILFIVSLMATPGNFR
ncbi:hypothetical protein CK203_064662 [Vitis vinifera]|uniref:Uncharacterized protein n=1 Tax=Vitis vinifera TaxID=29760 RepID=A0A438FQ81_VITVI|nr:hypothetical protein CK203_064662 [Vitis vinifera]